MLRPQDLVEHALTKSTSDQCLVIVHDTRTANLRWANNTLTTNGVTHSVDVTVIAFQGRAHASVSGSAASREQVAALTAAADEAATQAEESEDFAVLAGDQASPDWEELAARTGIEVFESFAHALGAAFDQADAAQRLLYGFVSHQVTTSYLGSSTGLRLRHVQPTGHYGCTAKDAALTNSAWVGGATRDFSDVSAQAMADALTVRLGWGARQVDLPAGRYDTVLPPTAVADLMIDAYWSAGARVAHDGQSAYSHTEIGQSLTKAGVNLFSDPEYVGLGSAPFVMESSSSSMGSVYDNGLPLFATDWIKDGRLTSLVQTRETAALTAQPFTPGIDNLVLSVDGGHGSDLDLVAGVEDGLLLTCLWYIREVDPQTLLLTGLTRDGVYQVKGGEIVGAVNNFRFNESPLDLLRRFSAAGTTVPSFSREWGDDYFSRTATPALRVPDFNMSSVSQAR